jgi:hypothetical protein
MNDSPRFSNDCAKTIECVVIFYWVQPLFSKQRYIDGNDLFNILSSLRTRFSTVQMKQYSWQ